MSIPTIYDLYRYCYRAPYPERMLTSFDLTEGRKIRYWVVFFNGQNARIKEVSVSEEWNSISFRLISNGLMTNTLNDLAELLHPLSKNHRNAMVWVQNNMGTLKPLHKPMADDIICSLQ